MREVSKLLMFVCLVMALGLIRDRCTGPSTSQGADDGASDGGLHLEGKR